MLSIRNCLSVIVTFAMFSSIFSEGVASSFVPTNNSVTFNLTQPVSGLSISLISQLEGSNKFASVYGFTDSTGICRIYIPDSLSGLTWQSYPYFFSTPTRNDLIIRFSEKKFTVTGHIENSTLKAETAKAWVAGKLIDPDGVFLPMNDITKVHGFKILDSDSSSAYWMTQFKEGIYHLPVSIGSWEISYLTPMRDTGLVIDANDTTLNVIVQDTIKDVNVTGYIRDTTISGRVTIDSVAVTGLTIRGQCQNSPFFTASSISDSMGYFSLNVPSRFNGTYFVKVVGLADSLVATPQNYRSVVAGARNIDFNIFEKNNDVEQKIGKSIGSVTLLPSMPNPFNPVTTLSFVIPSNMAHKGVVHLAIYNVKGELVKTVFNGYVADGLHTAKWYARDHSGQLMSAGLYFVKLSTVNSKLIQKIVLTK